METLSAFYLSVMVCSVDLSNCNVRDILPPFYSREDCAAEAMRMLKEDDSIQAYKCVEQKLVRS